MGTDDVEALISAAAEHYELDLSGRQLTELPASISQLTNLQTLRLGNNQLTELPASISQLTNLLTLTLGENQLTELPASISQLTNLQTLTLDYNQLTELPASISQLTNLQTLTLDGNRLVELPASIGQLTDLEDLQLNNNALAELPASVGQLTNLQTLWLDNNQLTELPASISQLTNLQTLWLDNNQLTELPASISQLTKLQTLTLNSNQLTEFPASISQLTNIQNLWLEGNQLTVLPANINEHTNLISLRLNSNQLIELPASISQLSNLQDLRLDNNQLTELPAGIGQLSNLQTLWLNNNQLAELPAGIGQLTHLQTLWLDNNRLSELPASISQLTKLHDLQLNNNRLSELPASISQLTNLETLQLNNNRLSELPASISQLTNLEDLRLNNNQLTELPASISQLTNLKNLALADNPLPEPLLAVLARQGASGVRRWLADLKAGVTLPEAKVLILGEGGVGKTSLVARLAGRGYVQRPRTHGIELERVPVRTEQGEVVLRFWDFGGQDVYRITHQFFFTPNTVYVVVFKAREGVERGDVEGWLDRIRLRVGSQARVLLVATHSHEYQPDVDLTYLSEVFGADLVGSFPVDNQSGQGIAELLEAVGQEALGLPHIRQTFPMAYVRFLDVLDQLKESTPQITWEQYLALASDAGLDTQQAESAAITLTVLGRATYFADHAALTGRVILQPDWLTTAISYVLNDEETRTAGGVISHQHLLDVWTNPPSHPGEPPDNRVRFSRDDFLYLTELMLLYGVSFPMMDGSSSLVAQMVPGAEPESLGIPHEVLTSSPVRRVVVAMGNRSELPGLIPWLTVRNQPFRTQARWRRGAVLYQPDDNAWALFRMPARDRIELTVWGQHPDAFYFTQRASLDAALGQWAALVPVVEVSCPTRTAPVGERASDLGLCPGTWPLKDLTVFAEEGDNTVRCASCRQQHEIAALLGRPTGTESEATVLNELKRQLTMITSELAAVHRDTARAHEVERVALVALSGGQDRIREDLSRLGDEARLAVDILLRVCTSQRAETPRIATFALTEERAWKPGSWFNDRYSMQLWCEYPGHQHPSGSHYDFKQPKSWWLEVAPYLRWVAFVLRFAPVISQAMTVAGDYLPKAVEVPLSGSSGTGSRPPLLAPNPAADALQTFTSDDLERVRHAFDLTTKLAAAATVDEEAPDFDPERGHNDLGQVDLRGLTALIKELCPIELGRLQYTPPSPAQIRNNPSASITPDGFGLWLCDHHYKIISPTASI